MTRPRRPPTDRILLGDRLVPVPRDAAADQPGAFLDAVASGGTNATAGPVGGADAAPGGTDAGFEIGPPPECSEAGECDDGFFCNGPERCERGKCLVAARPPRADDVECTANLCDEETDECVVDALDERCADGQICDLKVGCFLSVWCRADGDCDDATVCNGRERCVDGQCRPGEPLLCDDALDCTVDACDEARGDCRSVPDHTLCAPGELCSLQEGCRPRPPCGVDDDCDDAIFCNGPEVCEAATGNCLPGAVPPRDDGMPCTLDACDEDAGEVTHTPHNARCNNGELCDGFEVCRPDVGCVEGPPPPVSDGVLCTVDRCDEALDFIEHIPSAPACDDGLFCNGAEVCDPVSGCGPGEPVALSDGVGCMLDSCSEVEHRVLHLPEAARCDDGLFCNGAEACDPVAGCTPGPAPVLDDGIECTVDHCDEGAREVRHDPLAARCDDGLFCNGEESCDADAGCLPGAAPAVDDGLDCTADACDEAARTIEHIPVDALCDDGLVCSGTERCDVERGCQPGDAPGGFDGAQCGWTDCTDQAYDVYGTRL